ncbi:MAG: hypothetical protein Kow0090_04670 [Myxococcota bacterium]
MKIELQYIEGCPHCEKLYTIAGNAVKRLSIDATITKHLVKTSDEARRLNFLGSPTLLVDGRDIEGSTKYVNGLGCRLYISGGGVPEEWMVESALVRAQKPRGVLFMCVMNSARSQLAEAIARKFAPKGVEVFSAGSSPSRVHPLAIKVLEEAGFSTAELYSKSVDAIDPKAVQLVITLCAEEVCPVFLGKAYRFRWPFFDPASAGAEEEKKLEAFRKVRDELIKRIRHLFSY